MLEVFLRDVHRSVLPNGLTLVTRQVPQAGVVAINTWVKAGYFHEPDEVAGMAHLFEHMFFKGSKNFPGAEEIAQHVSSLGGVTNAGTIYDSTNYYFVLPAEAFQRGVEIQADAILNPLFDPEELRKEAEVVIEESNRKFDNPPALATERMYAEAFREHRMRRWRIGSNEVLRNIRRDDLLIFFETLYRPANIIVAIAGDVTHEDALSIVSETFGRLPTGKPDKRGGPSEPPQTAFRFGESFGDIRQAYAVFGWHTPGENQPDDEALDLAATVLGSGRYSRFYRNAVGPDAASSVSAGNSTFEDVGIFTVRASADEGNLREAERRVIGEIEALRKHGPSEYELQLAKNRIEAGFVFELQDVLGQAQTLAQFESREGYAGMESYLSRINSVTPAEVRDVAARYLTITNLTLYRYRPAGSPPSVASEVESEVGRLIETAGTTAAIELPLPVSGSPLLAAGGEPLRRFVLSNGVTLFVLERGGTPIVSTAVYFRGGRIYEQSGNAGITQLMARSMKRGTESRTGEQIDREIEFIGSQISVSVDEDFFGFSTEVVRERYRDAIGILADVITSPVFPDEGIEEERHLQLASIKRSTDSASERAFELLFELLYRNHPYALPAAGFSSTVESIDAAALRNWYGQQVVAEESLIVVAGDVGAEDVFELMEQAFGKGIRKGETLRPPVASFVASPDTIEVIETRKRKQTTVVVGFPTVPPEHPDWIPLRILQDVTSGLAGTFFRELRGKRALAYTVFAGDSSRERAGAFVACIASDTAKELEARTALLEELRRLGTDGITEADLDRARSYIAGVTRIRLQTNGALAGEIAQNYLYGLGLDFSRRFLSQVAKTTLSEIREVAQKYLSGENYVMATVRGRGDS